MSLAGRKLPRYLTANTTAVQWFRAMSQVRFFASIRCCGTLGASLSAASVIDATLHCTLR